MTPESFDDDQAVVAGDAYRHLFRARRLETGAELRVVDGLGHARQARVESIDRQQAVLVLGDGAPSLEPARQLRLVVAAPRPERASWLVEKATELGVVAIHFVRSQRTARSFGDGFRKRLTRVASAAVEQCHRSLRPEITGVDAWTELPRLLQRDADVCWVLDPLASTSTAATSDRAVVAIGPEGGWTAEERQELAGLGCRGLRLGSRILRVETAAVAIAARWLS